MSSRINYNLLYVGEKLLLLKQKADKQEEINRYLNKIRFSDIPKIGMKENLKNSEKESKMVLGDRVKLAAAVVTINETAKVQDVVIRAADLQKTAAYYGVAVSDEEALVKAAEAGAVKSFLGTKTGRGLVGAGIGGVLGGGVGALTADEKEDRLRRALIGAGIGAGAGGAVGAGLGTEWGKGHVAEPIAERAAKIKSWFGRTKAGHGLIGAGVGGALGGGIGALTADEKEDRLRRALIGAGIGGLGGGALGAASGTVLGQRLSHPFRGEITSLPWFKGDPIVQADTTGVLYGSKLHGKIADYLIRNVPSRGAVAFRNRAFSTSNVT